MCPQHEFDSLLRTGKGCSRPCENRCSISTWETLNVIFKDQPTICMFLPLTVDAQLYIYMYVIFSHGTLIDHCFCPYANKLRNMLITSLLDFRLLVQQSKTPKYTDYCSKLNTSEKLLPANLCLKELLKQSFSDDQLIVSDLYWICVSMLQIIEKMLHLASCYTPMWLL